MGVSGKAFVLDRYGRTGISKLTAQSQRQEWEASMYPHDNIPYLALPEGTGLHRQHGLWTEFTNNALALNWYMPSGSLATPAHGSAHLTADIKHRR